jgi:hypothetical protein
MVEKNMAQEAAALDEAKRLLEGRGCERGTSAHAAE